METDHAPVRSRNKRGCETAKNLDEGDLELCGARHVFQPMQ
jgi:hypothetical protein